MKTSWMLHSIRIREHANYVQLIAQLSAHWWAMILPKVRHRICAEAVEYTRNEFHWPNRSGYWTDSAVNFVWIQMMWSCGGQTIRQQSHNGTYPLSILGSSLEFNKLTHYTRCNMVELLDFINERSNRWMEILWMCALVENSTRQKCEDLSKNMTIFRALFAWLLRNCYL